MALYKRGSVWWMSFYFENKHVQKSTKCTNKRDAETVERAYRTQLAKAEVGILPKTAVPTFEQAMQDFLAWSKNEHAAKPNTHLSYKTASKSLFLFFGDAPLDSVEPSDVERYKQWRQKQRRQSRKKNSKQVNKLPLIKPATINRELSLLKTLFNRLIRNDVLSKNPVSKVKLLKENNEQMRVLSNDEEKIYLLVASQPLQDIAILMLDCGCRPDELFRLERKNVFLEKNYLFIPYGKTKAARRKVPLSSRAKSVLERRLTENKGEHVFPSEKTGKLITTLKTAHKGALKRSKLEHFRIYDLRHTFATRAVEAGVDLVTLAALLGHSRVQMLMRYAHPTENHKFEAIQIMEASYNRKTA